MLDTSPGDNQEDATFHDVIVGDADNERQDARHSPLAADDQRESPNHTCPPLFEHLNGFDDANSIDIGKEEKADTTGSRCDNTRHDIGTRSPIVVYPTWLPTFQSEYTDADENRGAQRSSRPGCLRANSSLAIVRRGHDKDAIHETSGIHSLPDVARPQQSTICLLYTSPSPRD